MSNGLALLRVINLDRLTNRAAALYAMGFEPRNEPCFRVENADADRARVYVYEVIGGWYLDTAEFVKAVHDIKSSAIDLHVNSPGGLVFDAVSMYEALRSHPAEVTTHIDGLAASAASFISLAGDTVEIAKAGRVMIHDAQGVGIGNAEDLRQYADLLDDISVDISGFYADKAGGSPAAWRAAMQANAGDGTWYSAQQAVDAGLADRIAGSDDADNSARNTTNAAADMRSQLIRARARVALGGVK
ncbi:head maturation protease, ClpP-related [Actinoplanes sp. CA-142083]|uniref:head maturation protease, ClpP-related n=1 Tax=Actinoplanes sp. CA-142083 TaxID=3239903 RepID=UPI003D8E3E88